MKKSYLVTGGSGFLGSALVRRLVKAGHEVRVFDDDSRGNVGRLQDIQGHFEFVSGDIRSPEAVEKATRGVDSVCHLAFVNGTEFFYSRPELVLDVGVKGIINVVDACLKNKVDELILASSSEVYQNPPVVPTAEDCPMVIPNPLNPRYSYAAGKMISEIIAINYGRTLLNRVVIFRPHNVYGPEMGWEHVIPQFILRMKEACKDPSDPVRFPIQGTGKQTRSFVFIEDFTDGLMLVINKGEHLGIYHIGTMDEVTIDTLAKKVGEYFGRPVAVMPSDEPLGGTPRRCPDIQKLSALGYHAKYSLEEGLRITAEWYDKNSHRGPVKKRDPRGGHTRARDQKHSGREPNRMSTSTQLTAGTGTSTVVGSCQVCDEGGLEPALFLGYLPPVNQMRHIGDQPFEQPAYPAQMLVCPKCQLVQLGLVVDPHILFPPDYPYTSGTTRILRENFAEMYSEHSSLFPMRPEDLAIDIGSNDGTLLSNFHNHGHRVHGIEPSQVGNIANSRGIKTTISFFGRPIAAKVRASDGPAKVITATNVFAHIENIHEIVESILLLLDDDGVFISESHYLMSLLETLQYDTIYHEHLRYYSLHSLQYLLRMHGLEVIHAKRIPTHGGSIRVYAARTGKHQQHPTVKAILDAEQADGFGSGRMEEFKKKVVLSKLHLQGLLAGIKEAGQRVYGIGAPSRASTLINYVGLDDGILDCVLEVKGSLKVGKYMPGTVIPVIEEGKLYEDQPEYALLLSWHIADELIPKLKEKGFRGKFIVPLPTPEIR